MPAPSSTVDAEIVDGRRHADDVTTHDGTSRRQKRAKTSIFAVETALFSYVRHQWAQTLSY